MSESSVKWGKLKADLSLLLLIPPVGGVLWGVGRLHAYQAGATEHIIPPAFDPASVLASTAVGALTLAAMFAVVAIAVLLIAVVIALFARRYTDWDLGTPDT